MSLSSGTRFGAYEITAFIGAGGMGEVYRARDTRLGRDVAIKVLSAAGAHSGEHRARFAREARAIAALNHPNICTLFDVGEHEGRDFLVLELLQGETLAVRLSRAAGPLPLGEALSIGSAVADALGAAHRTGFVHRDLKPANVMLTPHGVKVLDFGLARAVALRPDDGATITDAHTAQGVVLGTLPYMAPEQVEGRATDARTDIFALGAVLYELLSGVRPFQGDSTARVAAAILTAEPPALAGRMPPVPAAVEGVVRKCLEKAPEARWQSALEAADELRRVASLAPSSDMASGARRDASGAADGSETARDRPSSIATASTAWWKGRTAIALAAGVAVAVGAATLWQSRRQAPAATSPSSAALATRREPQHTQVTFEGNVQHVAISPDGVSLAYSTLLSDGTQRLWVRDVGSGQGIEVARAGRFDDIQWLPDGTRVAYSAYSGRRFFEIVPRLGGSPRRLPLPGSGYFALSPDGSAVARVATTVRISQLDDTEIRSVPLPPHKFSRQVVWPTSETLFMLSEGDNVWRIWSLPVDGRPAALVYESPDEVSAIAADADGATVYALRRRGTSNDLIRVRTGGSSAAETLLTGLPVGGQSLSVSRAGVRLAHVRGSAQSNLWVSRDDTTPGALTRGSQRLLFPSVSADGEIVIATNLAGQRPEVVRIDADGTLTALHLGKFAAVSPDGARLVFVSDREGEDRVWIGGVDGSAVREITGARPGDGMAWWTGDGRVAWQLEGLRGYATWDPASDATEELRPDRPEYRWWLWPFLTGPSRLEAAVHVNGRGGIQTLIYDLRSHQFRRLEAAKQYAPFAWDGTNILASDYEIGRDVYRVPLRGGQAKLITRFPGNLFGCGGAPAKRLIVCAVDETRSDAWVVDHFDPQVVEAPNPSNPGR